MLMQTLNLLFQAAPKVFATSEFSFRNGEWTCFNSVNSECVLRKGIRMHPSFVRKNGMKIP